MVEANYENTKESVVIGKDMWDDLLENILDNKM